MCEVRGSFKIIELSQRSSRRPDTELSDVEGTVSETVNAKNSLSLPEEARLTNTGGESQRLTQVHAKGKTRITRRD